MQLTCVQKYLSEGLAAVGRAISSRSTLPILSNVLLTADRDQGQLQLTATNLEIGISYRVRASVDESGSFTLPAKFFAEFVKSLPPGDVKLTLPKDSTTMQIAGLRSRATMHGQDAAEFPVIPTIPDAAATISLECNTLKEAIESVAFAAAEDESRPVLNGILVHREGEEGELLTFAAADAFNLAVRSYLMPDMPEEALRMGVLIPARTLVELARILPAEEQVEMIVTPGLNQVLFHTANLDLVSRLIEGAFPNYRQIIPPSYGTRARLETKAFAEIVKSAALFASSSSNILRVSIVPKGEEGLGNGYVQLEASSEDLGNSVSTLDAAVEGAELQIVLNVKYLAEALSSIQTSEVALEVSSASRPVVLRPVGPEKQCCVIMPMHVNR